MLSMLIYTGIRRNELLHLKYTDVDIENMSLFIRQGKGSKDRVLPICATLAETLVTYLKERKKLNKTCPEFFVSLNRNMGFTESGIKRMTDTLRKASDIHFTMHRFRHTFAINLLLQGTDIAKLQQLLGHNDIRMTAQYLRALPAQAMQGDLEALTIDNLY